MGGGGESQKVGGGFKERGRKKKCEVGGCRQKLIQM